MKKILKRLCRKNKTSIHQMEMDLNFGNGYITKLDISKKIPEERLMLISNYFNLDVDYFLDNEDLQLLIEKSMTKREYKFLMHYYKASIDSRKLIDDILNM